MTTFYVIFVIACLIVLVIACRLFCKPRQGEYYIFWYEDETGKGLCISSPIDSHMEHLNILKALKVYKVMRMKGGKCIEVIKPKNFKQ